MLKYEKLVSISYLPPNQFAYIQKCVCSQGLFQTLSVCKYVYIHVRHPPHTHTHTQPFGICNFVFVANDVILVQKRYDEIVLEIKDMDILSLYSSSLFRMIFES